MPTTRVGELTLAWSERGDGAPLLGIMGLGGRGSDWNERGFLALLADRFRIVTFDNRGTGASDKPTAPYTLEEMADEAVGILDAAGLTRAHVMGISMGGMIAQLVALRHPTRVHGLVLMATHPGGGAVVPPTAEAMTALTPDRTQAARDIVRQAMSVVTAPGFAARHPEAIEAIADIALAQPTPPFVFLRQLQAVLASDRSALLPGITAPTLVIHGDADPLVPAANGELLARAIPGARHVTLSGCGHLVPWEAPQAAAAAVDEFLTQLG